MSAEPKAPIESPDAEPFVWDGPGIVTYDENGWASIEMTPEEYAAFWEREVQETLGITGAEFLRKLDAGEYGEAIDWPENRDALYFAMCRPAHTRPRRDMAHG